MISITSEAEEGERKKKETEKETGEGGAVSG